jgi:hypothetical protein
MTNSLNARCPIVTVRADTRDLALHGGSTVGQDVRRSDFSLLQETLAARIVDLNDVEASRIGRLTRRVGGTYAAIAVTAFLQRARTTAYVTGSENEAIILALLMKVTRTRRPIVAVGVYPAKPQKWPFWRLARVHTHMHKLMPLVTTQAERLVNDLGVPSAKIEVLEKATPRESERPYFFAAGLQHRDYLTLIKAADGLDVDVLIAAASLWSKSNNELSGMDLPEWVTVTAMDYHELRNAYAGALAVVAPTVESDFAPGTTSILEGMSMGKPVVATRAAGSGDLIMDRRRLLRRGPHRATSAAFAARLASRSAQGPTGLLVPPGDVDEMRSALRWLLDHPEEARDLGARGRKVAAEVHSLEAYVERITAAVQQGVEVSR